MAQRRMLSRVVTDSDLFLDLPASAQALYFHLNMHADDDGFVDSTKSIMRMVGAHDDDLKVLIAKQFLLTFDTGVIVIKDWRLHNSIRRDRYKETNYQDEFKRLRLSQNGSYELEKPVTPAIEESGNQMATKRQPLVAKRLPQVRLGKDRLGKDSKEVQSPAKAEPPIDYQAVIDYLNQQSGKHYRNTKTNQQLIKARLDDGYTHSDVKAAIDNVIVGWKGTDMEQYIRPSTIFRASKFEGYVNAVPRVFTDEKPKSYGKPKRQEAIPEWMRPGYQAPKAQASDADEAELAANLAELKEALHQHQEEKTT